MSSQVSFDSSPVLPGGAEPQPLVLRCALSLLIVITAGTLGFVFIEDWEFWRAAYFTLITITTVGYGDEGLSPMGKTFAAVLILLGIGVATYSLSQLVQVAANCQFAWRRRMNKKIKQLENHVLVCGYGRMGRSVCERLSQQGIPFVVVEPNAAPFEEAVGRGFLAIHGDATKDDVLREGRIESARSVVCTANCDAENVFITLSGRELNAKAFIVSRADADDAIHKLRRAGASLVISPYQAAGAQVASTIVNPNLAEIFCEERMGVDSIQLAEVHIRRRAPLVGQTVGEFGRQEDDIVFVAMRRAGGETILRPRGDTVFEQGDVVFAAGRVDDLARMKQLADSSRKPVDTLAAEAVMATA